MPREERDLENDTKFDFSRVIGLWPELGEAERQSALKRYSSDIEFLWREYFLTWSTRRNFSAEKPFGPLELGVELGIPRSGELMREMGAFEVSGSVEQNRERYESCVEEFTTWIAEYLPAIPDGIVPTKAFFLENNPANRETLRSIDSRYIWSVVWGDVPYLAAKFVDSDDLFTVTEFVVTERAHGSTESSGCDLALRVNCALCGGVGSSEKGNACPACEEEGEIVVPVDDDGSERAERLIPNVSWSHTGRDLSPERSGNEKNNRVGPDRLSPSPRDRSVAFLEERYGPVEVEQGRGENFLLCWYERRDQSSASGEDRFFYVFVGKSYLVVEVPCAGADDVGPDDFLEFVSLWGRGRRGRANVFKNVVPQVLVESHAKYAESVIDQIIGDARTFEAQLYNLALPQNLFPNRAANRAFPPEVAAAHQRYSSWVDTYGPFEWVQFNEEGDADYVKASSVESALVWTEFHTGEHIEAVSGFAGPSGHWDLHGWYLASHPRETEPAVPESVIVEYSGPSVLGLRHPLRGCRL